MASFSKVMLPFPLAQALAQAQLDQNALAAAVQRGPQAPALPDSAVPQPGGLGRDAGETAALCALHDDSPDEAETDASAPPQTQDTVLLRACEACRKAKAKCSTHQRPCERCVRLELPCDHADGSTALKRACDCCVKAKVACDLSAGQPCARCRRMGKECVMDSERTWKTVAQRQGAPARKRKRQRAGGAQGAGAFAAADSVPGMAAVPVLRPFASPAALTPFGSSTPFAWPFGSTSADADGPAISAMRPFGHCVAVAEPSAQHAAAQAAAWPCAAPGTTTAGVAQSPSTLFLIAEMQEAELPAVLGAGGDEHADDVVEAAAALIAGAMQQDMSREF